MLQIAQEVTSPEQQAIAFQSFINSKLNNNISQCPDVYFEYLTYHTAHLLHHISDYLDYRQTDSMQCPWQDLVLYLPKSSKDKIDNSFKELRSHNLVSTKTSYEKGIRQRDISLNAMACWELFAPNHVNTHRKTRAKATIKARIDLAKEAANTPAKLKAKATRNARLDQWGEQKASKKLTVNSRLSMGANRQTTLPVNKLNTINNPINKYSSNTRDSDQNLDSSYPQKLMAWQCPDNYLETLLEGCPRFTKAQVLEREGLWKLHVLGKTVMRQPEPGMWVEEFTRYCRTGYAMYIRQGAFEQDTRPGNVIKIKPATASHPNQHAFQSPDDNVPPRVADDSRSDMWKREPTLEEISIKAEYERSLTETKHF